MRKPGVETQRLTWCDRHIGSRDELINAGIARAEHFPDHPGNDVCSNKWQNGVKLHKSNKRITKDETFFRVGVYGRFYEVHVGLPAEERQRRVAADEADKMAKRTRERERQEQRMHVERIAEQVVANPRVHALVDAYASVAARSQEARPDFCRFLFAAIIAPEAS